MLQAKMLGLKSRHLVLLAVALAGLAVQSTAQGTEVHIIRPLVQYLSLINRHPRSLAVGDGASRLMAQGPLQGQT